MSFNNNKPNASMPQSQASHSPESKPTLTADSSSSSTGISHTAPTPQTKPSLKIKLSLSRKHKGNTHASSEPLTAVVIPQESKQEDEDQRERERTHGVEPMSMELDSESLQSNNDGKSEEDSLRTAQEEASLSQEEEEEEMMQDDAPEAEDSIAGGEEEEDDEEEEENEEEAPLTTTLKLHVDKKAYAAGAGGGGGESNANSMEEDDRSSLAPSQESGSAMGSSTTGQVRRGGRTRSTSFDVKDTTTTTTTTTSSPNKTSSHPGPSPNPSSSNRDDKDSSHPPKARTSLTFRDPLLPSTNTTGNAHMTSSFLDSLSETQKRTMTRQLPDVAGFRRLLKSDIKKDLNAIKSMLKHGGSSSGGGSGNGGTFSGSSSHDVIMGGGEEEDGVGTNQEVSALGGEDDLTSEEEDVVTSYKTVDLAQSAQSFMLPHPGSDSHFLTSTTVKSKEKKKEETPQYSSPHVIEAITAFNPPRPPESVGPKKQHRLERWERNPHDVEVNIANYRKTVDKTREELHKAEAERERLLTVGDHMKRHYMNQWRGMRQETSFLQKHFLAIQEECVEAAELLTSKTRSRGSGRGAHIMKDVLAVLKARGAQPPSDCNGTDQIPEGNGGGTWCVPGVGGICTEKHDAMLAGGWILPQDVVSTPYGDGTVLESFGETCLNGNSAVSRKNHNQPPQSKELHNQQTLANGGIVTILPPRVCVQLGFGKGYFHPSVVTIKNNPAALNDERLVARWRSMIESGLESWSSMDALGMDHYYSKARSSKSNDVDDATLSTTNDERSKNRLVPFGSGILPLSSVPGGGLETLTLDQLENTVTFMLNRNGGILGDTDNNRSVPSLYKEWEDQRSELRELEGKKIQLQNKLLRQRRIRQLNQHTAESGTEQRDRFEHLLSDMKADMNSLKERLNDELIELGIDQEKAEELLGEYNRMESEKIELEMRNITGKGEIDHDLKKRRKLDNGSKVSVGAA